MIVAHTPPVIAAMRQASSSIPIVFAGVIDPVAHGFIDNLARPGGNLTGTTNIEFSLVGKMLEMLKEVAPGLPLYSRRTPNTLSTCIRLGPFHQRSPSS